MLARHRVPGPIDRPQDLFVDVENGKYRNISGAASNGSIIVAVGESENAGGDAYIITSDMFGKTWSERANPKNFTLKSVAFGAGVFSAVGDADGTDSYIVTSADGITWTERAPSVAKNLGLNSVIFGGGLFVAVGSVDGATDAYILTSPDGTTWTERANPKNFALRSVTYANSLYIAVGDADGTDAYIITSPDGTTWTERANPKNFGLRAIAYGNGLYVSMGVSDGVDTYCVSSPDGITWTERAPSVIRECLSLEWDSSRFLACGYDTGPTGPYLIYSLDGVTWSPVTPYFGLYPRRIFSTFDRVLVFATDNLFLTFTERVNQQNRALRSVVSGNGILVAVGDGTGSYAYIVTSPDGITWTERSNPKNFVLNGIAFGSGLFVAVGLTGGRQPPDDLVEITVGEGP